MEPPVDEPPEPGPDAAQIKRVAAAARAVLDQLTKPLDNVPLEPDVPVRSLRAVCLAFAEGEPLWIRYELEIVMQARRELGHVFRDIRERHDRGDQDPGLPSAYDAARNLKAVVNELYVELDLALDTIPPEERDAAQALVLSREDLSVPSSDPVAEAERADIEPRIADVRRDLARVDEARQVIIEDHRTQVVGDINVSVSFGDLKISIDKIKAQLASLNISFNAKQLWKGTIEIGGKTLGALVESLKTAAARIEAAVGEVGDLAAAVKELVQPIADAVKGGKALKERVMAAVKRLFGPKEELPWPTGLRLLPPEGRPDEPREVELHKVRRFDAGDGTISGLAPLPGGRFVSGGRDNTLRLWSVGETAPLAELTEHTDRIWRIAALDGNRVVTASGDKTLILWDLEKRTVLQRFKGHERMVLDVCALGPNRFVSVADVGDCRVWRVGQAEAERIFDFRDPRGLAALSPSNFVTGEYFKDRLCLLDPNQDEPIAELEQDGSDVWKATALATDRFLTVRAGSTEVRLWDVDRGPPATLTGDATCQDVAALSSTRAISAHNDGLILWALPEGERLAKLDTPSLYGVRALPPEPGGPPRFVACGDEGYLALWEVRPKTG